jgi:mannitol-1-phosphate 5-dehydrogenase
MANRTFVGFGFGAIQAGLFLYEAHRSRRFDRLVVAEVLPEVVAAVRKAGGCYAVNIAGPSGIRSERVEGVEILNPAIASDAALLAEALAQANEICTALPSVETYDRGDPSVAALLATMLSQKQADPDLPPCVVYTAENHNHAAEILQALCDQKLAPCAPGQAQRVQFLNTVIGKMSKTVAAEDEILAQGLAPVVPGFTGAFLVEQFNRIMISRITLPHFQRGLEQFIEKPDLLPFEEAKLYGHNAVHALLGYLARAKGYPFISDCAQDPALMELAREAFVVESGGALLARHKGVDSLFTPAGYQAYAADLLVRMTNPWLRDETARVTRDTPRKLGWNDRLVGTMRLALDAGISPKRFALAAAAAVQSLPSASDWKPQLQALWNEQDEPPGRKAALFSMIEQARQSFASPAP